MQQHKSARLFFMLMVSIFCSVFTIVILLWPHKTQNEMQQSTINYNNYNSSGDGNGNTYKSKSFRSWQRVENHNPLLPTSKGGEWGALSRYITESSMTLQDAKRKGWRSTVYFERKVHDLSRLFKQFEVPLNFIFIGACDGTHDKTLEDFVRNGHWRGILVEPVSFNFMDLKKFIHHNNLDHRAVAVRAAVTGKCPESKKVNLTLSDWYLRDPSQEHWVTRQTATLSERVIEGMKEDIRKRRTFFKFLHEEVMCLEGDQVVNEWKNFIDANTTMPNNTNIDPHPFRPHILKVDAEGHDYEILYSFFHRALSDPSVSLPLILQFESKLFEPFNKRKLGRLLEDLGYESNLLEESRRQWGDDSIAILKSDFISKAWER